MHGYVGYRVIPNLNLSPLNTILAFVFIFFFSLLPISPFLIRLIGFQSKFLDKISFIGYTSLGFFTLSFIALIAKDFLSQLLAISTKLINSDYTLDDSKREFLKKTASVGIIGITGPATAFGLYSARKGPSVINQEIFLDTLPKEFDNFTIAQISDLHVGPTIKRPYVEGVVDKISHLNPDLIAVTGDLVDGSVEYLRSDTEPLKNMIAKYGTYFVTGNHEYYSGVDQWLDETDRIGMINLLNSHVVLEKKGSKIVIAGVTDFKADQIKPAHKSNPFLALKTVPPLLTKIVLAHQPRSIDAVNRAGAHLQLSGHTHGGQFWPFTYPTKLANKYLAGYYNHNGTHIYVNRGTGYWGPPLRLGVPAEISLIKLRSI